MAGPIEILIVVGVFGIIGTYLYIVHRFIGSGDERLGKPDSPQAVSERNRSASKIAAVTSH
jgi:hypothetical protein